MTAPGPLHLKADWGPPPKKLGCSFELAKVSAVLAGALAVAATLRRNPVHT